MPLEGGNVQIPWSHLHRCMSCHPNLWHGACSMTFKDLLCTDQLLVPDAGTGLRLVLVVHMYERGVYCYSGQASTSYGLIWLIDVSESWPWLHVCPGQLLCCFLGHF